MGRLEAQCLRILALLKARHNIGVTNRELSEIALKYTSRISDLRAAGHDIRCFMEGDGGLYRYVYYGTVKKGQSRLFGGRSAC